jgi:drug/metabolite transporter (DMT)-like permease
MARRFQLHDYVLYGVLPILGASTLWAFGYFIRKTLLKDVSAFALVWLTAVMVAAFMFVGCRLDLKKVWKRFKAHKYRFIGLSVSGVLLGQTLMYIALDRLDLGVTTLLEKLQPIFTIWMAALFLKEKLSANLVPYCVLALISSYFISVPHPLEGGVFKADLIGILAVVAAAFFWGISSTIGRSLAKVDIGAGEIAFLRFSIAAVLSAPFFFLLEGTSLSDHQTSWQFWGLLFIAAIGGTGCGYLLYYRGLKHVDAPTAGFLELLTPVIALGLGIVFLQERLSWTQWSAIPVMLFAVWRITTAPRRLPVVEEAA